MATCDTSRRGTCSGTSTVSPRAVHYDVLYLNSAFSPRFSLLPLLLRRIRLARPPSVIVAPRGRVLPRRPGTQEGSRSESSSALAKIIGLYDGVLWQASAAPEVRHILADHWDRHDRRARRVPEVRPNIATVGSTRPPDRREAAWLGPHRVPLANLEEEEPGRPRSTCSLESKGKSRSTSSDRSRTRLLAGMPAADLVGTRQPPHHLPWGDPTRPSPRPHARIPPVPAPNARRELRTRDPGGAVIGLPGDDQRPDPVAWPDRDRCRVGSSSWGLTPWIDVWHRLSRLTEAVRGDDARGGSVPLS